MKTYTIPKMLFDNIDKISMVEKLLISHLSSVCIKNNKEVTQLKFNEPKLKEVYGLTFNDIVGKDFFAIQVLFRVSYVTIEFKNRMHIPSTYKQTLRYDPTANKVVVKEKADGNETYKNTIKNLNDRIAFLEGEYSRLKKEISKTEDERIRYKKDNDNYYQFYQTVISKMNRVLEDHADTHGMTDEEQDLYDQINEFVMDKYNSKGGNSWMDDLNSIITIAE